GGKELSEPGITKRSQHVTSGSVNLVAAVCLDRANIFTAEHAESAEFLLCFLCAAPTRRELCDLCGKCFGCGWKPRYGIIPRYES
ncbi:MAG: hypothetical protein ABIL11_03070, partial [Chloroflexota bacterium]